MFPYVTMTVAANATYRHGDTVYDPAETVSVHPYIAIQMQEMGIFV